MPKVLQYVLSFVLAIAVACASVAVVKQARLSSSMDTFERTTEELRKELAAYTVDSQLMGAVIAMGLNQNEMKQAVSQQSNAQRALSDSDEELKALRVQFRADGFYLINARGVIVSHETDGQPSTGADVTFRPYFQQAMAKKVSIYAAVGSRTGERGLYYAAPIYAEMRAASPVAGVVMAKLPGEPLDAMLKKYGNDALLLSPQEVVFASSRQGWLYNVMGAASPERLEQIKSLKQFGRLFESGLSVSLPFTVASDAATIDNKKYVAVSRHLDWGDPAGPWRIVTLWSAESVNPPGSMLLTGAGAGGLTLLLALMTLALRESRSKQQAAMKRFKFLGAALETSPLAVVMTDPEGLIRWVNPQFEKTSGYTSEELIGESPRIISSGLNAEGVIAGMWRTILSGDSWHGELVNKRKDGSLYDARNIITPVYDERPGLLGFVGLQEDVTEQKRAELALKSAQAEMTQIFNTAASGMRLIDKQRTILKVNDAYVALTGYTREELVGRKCHEVFSGAECLTEDCQFADILAGNGRVETTVIRETKGGELVYCDVASTPFVSPSGEVLGAIQDFRDMTERMKAQSIIRQSEIKYRELVENASSIILKLDMEGNITFFNEFAQSFFGFSQDEVLGRHITETIAPRKETDGSDLRALIDHIVRHPELHGKNENENLCKDGRKVWVSWTNQVIKDGGSEKPSGLLCIGQDATERKKAQDALYDAMEVISGSIRYASRIQRAILPAPDQFSALIPRHFALWEPRDVVGGDMYWIRPWGQGVLLILADCTGHGVPGAFITLISSGALDRACVDVAPGDPAELITRINRYVKVVLSQDAHDSQEDSSDDGLELGVCYIPPDKSAVTFAGAHFQLFTVISGEVEIVKGDRKGIGYRFVPLEATFSNQTVPASPGRRFYMATDGLIDQIGGQPRRSFGKKRFMQLLLSLENTPITQQGAAIFHALEAHRGTESRRDDVAVVGFEV